MEIRTGQRCNPKNYTAGRPGAVLYLVIHYTGNNGDTAENNVRYFANNAVRASAHFFVDSREVVSSVPESDTAWHCGANSYRHPICRNANSIGIELCSYIAGGRYAFSEETLKNAVSLTAFLAKKYQIPTENILRHYDVTGKQCPEPMVRDGALWTRFLKEVKAQMEPEEKKLYHRAEDVPDWARNTVLKLLEKQVLKGDGEGKLALTEEMLRILVLHDRMKLYD